MAEPVLSLLNTVTTKRILPGVVDNVFKGGPFMAYLRRNRFLPWTGSDTIQENFLYKPMRGRAYAKGTKFNITKGRHLAGLTFNPKYYYTNVTEYLEDLEVEMRGPTAVLSLVKTDMANAMMSLSAQLEIAAFQHGTGTRALEINGLEEALNDGSTAGWNGAAFTSYGNQPRADVNNALNSPMTGIVSANMAGGQLNYRTLEQSYQSLVIGEESPQLGITTNIGMGYLNENFHPLQRIDTTDPVIGYSGIKFKKATIVQSQYCPGTAGVNDPDLGNYLASAGETFWWFNFGGEGAEDSYIRLHIAASKKFAFGFTGFKGEIDSNMVAGQVLVACQMTSRANRLSRYLYGIGG